MSQQITVPERIQRAIKALDFAATRTWWGLPIIAWTCTEVGENWISFNALVTKVGPVKLEYWELGFGSRETSHVRFQTDYMTRDNPHHCIYWQHGLMGGIDYPTEVFRVSARLYMLLERALPQIGITTSTRSSEWNHILGANPPLVRTDRMSPDGDARSLQDVYEATIFLGDLFDGYLQAWISRDLKAIRLLEINIRPFRETLRFRRNKLIEKITR